MATRGGRGGDGAARRVQVGSREGRAGGRRRRPRGVASAPTWGRWVRRGLPAAARPPRASVVARRSPFSGAPMPPASEEKVKETDSISLGGASLLCRPDCARSENACPPFQVCNESPFGGELGHKTSRLYCCGERVSDVGSFKVCSEVTAV